MPIIEYECAACSRRFEQLQASDDDVPACPHCGAARVRRLLSAFAVGRSQPDRPAGCGRGECACRADGN